MSNQRYDTVVIGAGTNGLTCASFLAQHGRKVLVCEERGVVGGLVAEDEFFPGYRSAGLLQDTARLRPAVVEALQLESHGLAWEDDEGWVVALWGWGDDSDPHLEPDDWRQAVETIGDRPSVFKFPDQELPETDLVDRWNNYAATGDVS